MGGIFKRKLRSKRKKYDNVEEKPESPRQMTDEEYYDRGDYERSYGEQ